MTAAGEVEGDAAANDAPALSPLASALRAGDRDRFEAALFAPEDRREALITLYAFNLEIARTPWRVSDPQLGAIRLRWWLDAIAEIYDGARPRQHEIVTPLAVLIRETNPAVKPPREVFEALIEARARDLDPSPMESVEAFEAYVAATSSGLVRLAAWVLTEGRETPALVAAAEDAGFAFGVAAAFRATPELAARGRLLLPPVDAERLDPAPILRGETTPALRRSIRRLARHASERMRLARSRRRSIPRPAAAAFLAGWRSDAALRAAERPEVDPFRDFGPESPFRRRASLLWRGFTGRW